MPVCCVVAYAIVVRMATSKLPGWHSEGMFGNPLRDARYARRAVDTEYTPAS